MKAITIAIYVCLATSAILLDCAAVKAGDWPMWRHDSNRSAATSEQLAEELHLQWWREQAPSIPAWPEDPRLQFDASYEPIVMGKTMYVGSSRNDSVTAIDTDTGAVRWRFFAEGPVRFAPVASQGRLYFGADDGCFYCLDAAKGTLRWKFHAAPAGRRAIGSERLISVWPMRGGPVLVDGKIHFTVGVWPFEGTLLYTLDAESGNVSQVRAADGSKAVIPDYSVASLKDLTPQGYLAASGNKLFIPSGRDKTGCIDMLTGKTIRMHYHLSGRTDYHVTAIGDWVFHGAGIYNVPDKNVLPQNARRPVMTDETLYFTNNGAIRAYDLKNPKLVDAKDRRGKAIKKKVLTELWNFSGEKIVAAAKEDPPNEAPLHIDIKSGERLYGHQGSMVFALDLPSANGGLKLSWTTTVQGTPSSMLTADGKLFVVTQQGRIYCFSAGKTEPKTYPTDQRKLAAIDDPWTAKAGEILKLTNTSEGYCLAWGIGSGRLIEELLRQSELRVIAIDPDQGKVEAARRRFDANGLYGTRVVAHVGDLASFTLPPYMANLIVSEDPQTVGIEQGKLVMEKMFHALRPYGGTVCLEISDGVHDRFALTVKKSKLQQARISRRGGYTLLSRQGALPGSSDWTHEYGGPGNTLMSPDKIVKAPFGVLWFGGPSSQGDLYYDRHHWGPSMAVIEGRMLIQGPDKLTAVDVYTGRILWQIPLDDAPSQGRRGNFFDSKTPLGRHFVAVHDGIYFNAGKICRWLDPATGQTIDQFKLPTKDGEWGRMRILNHMIITSVFHQVDGRGKLPTEIVALDRHNGKVLWSAKATYSCPFVAIGKDKVYFFDGILTGLYNDWLRKGKVPAAQPDRYVKALDIKTGKLLWERTTDMVVTWVGYSQQQDVLVTSNKLGMVALRGSDGKELWKKQAEGKGFLGHPENLWDKVILWNDRIIDQRGPGFSYSLKTGKNITYAHPITGKTVPWQFTKTGHHCNYAIASPHLLTFRAASAGFLDLESCSTSRLEGFRSGCRNSLIPANGVLNAPNFAFGCGCNYSLFTSLALVHVPESDLWTYSAYEQTSGRVGRVGINFGAPGDRRSETGTLWLDYPSVGGPSPNLPLKVATEQPHWFRLHTSLIQGDSLKWVASSGVLGIQTVKIPLEVGKKKPTKGKNHPCTVRLYFAEPKKIAMGERVFDVKIQDRDVLTDFDIVKQAGGHRRVVVKEISGVQANSEITITFTPKRGKTLICGVEVVSD